MLPEKRETNMTDAELIEKVFKENGIKWIPRSDDSPVDPDKILIRDNDVEIWLDRDFNIFDTSYMDKE